LCLFMGQLSSSATAAIRRSLSSCSIAHSSSMCSVVWLSFPAWAVWCVDDFKPVEVWFYVTVARNHCCEVLCKNSPVWCSVQRIFSPVLVHSCICIAITVPVHILFMGECTRHFDESFHNAPLTIRNSQLLYTSTMFLYPAAALLWACSQANTHPHHLSLIP
jgi:hypothetical protein